MKGYGECSFEGNEMSGNEEKKREVEKESQWNS